MSDNIKPLSQARAVHLGRLLQAVAEQRKCAWINDYGDEVGGTMRSLMNEDWQGFRGDDVRNAKVRVTTSSGCEILLPVEHVLDATGQNEFFIVGRGW